VAQRDRNSGAAYFTSMNKRPLSVTILACIYIGVGTVGFVYHFRPILASHAFHYDDFLVELSEIVAIVCGAFLLRGHNWARWLALAWIAFHVGISFFDSLQKVVVHGLLLLLIAYFLFRPEARIYFRQRETMSV
jgi:hypothetical protein